LRGEVKEWLSPFISAMHDRAKKQAPQQLTNIDLSGIKSMQAITQQMIYQKDSTWYFYQPLFIVIH
jgi:hypothetical protein